MNLALLVVSYGVSHRLFEFAWKGQLRALYPTPAAYQVRRQGPNSPQKNRNRQALAAPCAPPHASCAHRHRWLGGWSPSPAFPVARALQSVLADVSIATGWCTIALMLLGKFVFQCERAGRQLGRAGRCRDRDRISMQTEACRPAALQLAWARR